MSVETILHSLQNCPCGKKHTTRLRAIEIDRGCKERTAEILTENGFPKKILVVAQQSTLDAAHGILDILQYGGFILDLYLYDAVCFANTHSVERIRDVCRKSEGILSIGSGTVCDICRRAAFLEDKEFAIFATAPSMDGFASDTAPITHNSFKVSLPAQQPSVIVADTDILAAAPAVLKSAG